MEQRVWKVGDVVSGAEAYASLPVGTTVWPCGDEPGTAYHQPNTFWKKAATNEWLDSDQCTRFDDDDMATDSRVIRSLPVAPSTGDVTPPQNAASWERLQGRVVRTTLKAAPFDAYEAPLGTVVHYTFKNGRTGAVMKEEPCWWVPVEDHDVGFTDKCVNEDVERAASYAVTYPPAPAPFDAAKAPVGTVVDFGRFIKGEKNFWKCETTVNACNNNYIMDECAERDHTITYPPAPAERQPCAAWRRDSEYLWVLPGLAIVRAFKDGGGHVEVRGKFCSNVTTTLVDAQLAAEDALLSDARSVFTLLGKAVG
jgi:hypothetical protein